MSKHLESIEFPEIGKYDTDHLARTIEESKNGAIVSFNDGANLPVADLKVGIDAVQNLHSYDHPWVGGAGKNKLPLTKWFAVGYSQTISGVTFTITQDGGIKISGTNTSSSNADFQLSYASIDVNPFYVDEGTWTVSVVGGTSDAILIMSGGDNGFPYTETNTHTTGTVTDATKPFSYVIARVRGNASANTTMYLQLEQGSSATTYAPYVNICPISGWTGAKVTVQGINQWDEEWEVGGINPNTGAKEYASDRIRSKNYCPCCPNTDYYCSSSNGSVLVFWYDESKNFIPPREGFATNAVFTSPANARYFMLHTYGYGTTYNHDISINYPSTDHDYHAYDGHTYEVTWQDEAGTVYGGTLDVTTGELTVTVKAFSYSEVSLYGDYQGHPLYYTLISNYSTDVVLNMPEGSYAGVLLSNYFGKITGSNLKNGEIRTQDNSIPNRFYFRNDDVADLATFNAQLAVTPLQVVAQLKTPITYTISPTEVLTLLGKNNILADCGEIENVTYRADTKKYIDGTIVDVPLAMIASVETGTTASKAYAVGEYFILNGNQFCKAKTAIASGATFTLNTNYTVTTIGAELKALQ